MDVLDMIHTPSNKVEELLILFLHCGILPFILCSTNSFTRFYLFHRTMTA
jgi:hypothetical protein